LAILSPYDEIKPSEMFEKVIRVKQPKRGSEKAVKIADPIVYCSGPALCQSTGSRAADGT
jgi:hypothetical protein